MSAYLLRDIPTDLHKRLREFSKENGVSLRHIFTKGAENFMADKVRSDEAWKNRPKK